MFSPSKFRLADNRTCRTTAALLIASAGALFFLADQKLRKGPRQNPKEEKLGTIGGPRSSLAVAVSWSGYFSEVDFIFPFAIRQVDPPGSASRSPSSRRCHLENALREVSKPRRQCPLHKRASATGRREWNQGKAPDFPTGLWTFLRGGEWISPQCLGNLAPVTSAHTGYSQQFCSRQMLQISDHLIPGQV